MYNKDQAENLEIGGKILTLAQKKDAWSNPCTLWFDLNVFKINSGRSNPGEAIYQCNYLINVLRLKNLF